MDVIVIVAIALLIIMGLFHFYWALGGQLGIDKALPTKDGKRLINPGKTLTFFVGILLLTFSFVAFSLHFKTVKTDDIIYAGWALSALFILRAVGDFKAVGFFKRIKSTKFAKYDTKYFSPLCLFLGVVFALLSVQIS